ncbi:hypothetical protein [Subtercola vilae]|uniref:Uncharacterized protein n=1 Tax=Subtercola vilae TaxID=2056433 RepID=A0A4T2BYH1_9MICO|nr:hypothetical protein [Subtercola vilae]TIH36152.1 hypothetical protein D4765_10235 [Subtercola vilae]
MVPLILIIITWALWLIAGVLKSAVGPQYSTQFGIANLLLPLVIIAEFIFVAMSLRSIRLHISKKLSEAGMQLTTQPAILTPTRFLNWSREQEIPLDRLSDVLSETPAQS